MAVTHVTALRTYLADAVETYLDSAGTSNCKLQIRASSTVLVEFVLSNPPFSAAVAGVITLRDTPINATAIAAGTADNAIILDAAGATAISCSVTGTGGGGDIEISNPSIALSQACILQSLSYAAPA